MRIAPDLRRDDELLQELLDPVKLCLQLAESRELDIELLADVGELFFDSGENFGAAERWPGRAAGATFAALTTSALFAHRSPSMSPSHDAADCMPASASGLARVLRDELAGPAASPIEYDWLSCFSEPATPAALTKALSW